MDKPGTYPLAPDDTPEKSLRQIRTLSFLDTPADDLSGKHIQDHIGKKIHALHIGFQPGNVPAPDLVGTGGRKLGRSFPSYRFSAFSPGLKGIFSPQDPVQSALTSVVNPFSILHARCIGLSIQEFPAFPHSPQLFLDSLAQVE